MSKNNFIKWTLYICTFGLFYLYLKNKSKNYGENNVSQSHSINFDINELVNLLGGKENIESVTSTLSSINIKLKISSSINTDSFKKFKFQGILLSKNILTIVSGNNASYICEEIKKII